MKEELQQALRVLERNLKDIQAANDTVEEVRAKADEDIDASRKLIGKLNTLVEEFDAHFNNWLQTFEKDAKNVLVGFDNKAKDTVKKMRELNTSLKSHFDANSESMSESNRLLFQKYESIWTKHNQELDRAYLKLEAMQQALESMARQIEKVDFPKKLDSIQNYISAVADSVKTQDKTLSGIENNHKTKFNILIAIGSVIIVLQVLGFFI